LNRSRDGREAWSPTGMELDLAGVSVGHDAPEIRLGIRPDPAAERARAKVEVNGALDRIG